MANLVIPILRVFFVGIHHISNKFKLFVSAVQTIFPTFDFIHEFTHGFSGMVNMRHFRQLVGDQCPLATAPMRRDVDYNQINR
jgi:hypothetical protein